MSGVQGRLTRYALRLFRDPFYLFAYHGLGKHRNNLPNNAFYYFTRQIQYGVNLRLIEPEVAKFAAHIGLA